MKLIALMAFSHGALSLSVNDVFEIQDSKVCSKLIAKGLAVEHTDALEKKNAKAKKAEQSKSVVPEGVAVPAALGGAVADETPTGENSEGSKEGA